MTHTVTLPEHIRGAFRADSTFIGFAYNSQSWIDTSPTCERDMSAPLGSACNPLSWLPKSLELIATYDQVDSDLDFVAAL